MIIQSPTCPNLDSPKRVDIMHQVKYITPPTVLPREPHLEYTPEASWPSDTESSVIQPQSSTPQGTATQLHQGDQGRRANVTAPHMYMIKVISYSPLSMQAKIERIESIKLIVIASPTTLNISMKIAAVRIE